MRNSELKHFIAFYSSNLHQALRLDRASSAGRTSRRDRGCRGDGHDDEAKRAKSRRDHYAQLRASHRKQKQLYHQKRRNFIALRKNQDANLG